MRYLDQEAVLQGWAGLTVLDGLGGEKELNQLLGAERLGGLD